MSEICTKVSEKLLEIHFDQQCISELLPLVTSLRFSLKNSNFNFSNNAEFLKCFGSCVSEIFDLAYEKDILSLLKESLYILYNTLKRNLIGHFDSITFLEKLSNLLYSEDIFVSDPVIGILIVMFELNEMKVNRKFIDNFIKYLSKIALKDKRFKPSLRIGLKFCKASSEREMLRKNGGFKYFIDLIPANYKIAKEIMIAFKSALYDEFSLKYMVGNGIVEVIAKVFSSNDYLALTKRKSNIIKSCLEYIDCSKDSYFFYLSETNDIESKKKKCFISYEQEEEKEDLKCFIKDGDESANSFTVLTLTLVSRISCYPHLRSHLLSHTLLCNLVMLLKRLSVRDICYSTIQRVVSDPLCFEIIISYKSYIDIIYYSFPYLFSKKGFNSLNSKWEYLHESILDICMLMCRNLEIGYCRTLLKSVFQSSLSREHKRNFLNFALFLNYISLKKQCMTHWMKELPFIDEFSKEFCAQKNFDVLFFESLVVLKFIFWKKPSQKLRKTDDLISNDEEFTIKDYFTIKLNKSKQIRIEKSVLFQNSKFIRFFKSKDTFLMASNEQEFEFFQIVKHFATGFCCAKNLCPSCKEKLDDKIDHLVKFLIFYQTDQISGDIFKAYFDNCNISFEKISSASKLASIARNSKILEVVLDYILSCNCQLEEKEIVYIIFANLEINRNSFQSAMKIKLEEIIC